MRFLDLLTLVATLLTACEPTQEVVAPQAITTKAAARLASATDSYGQMGLSYASKYDNGVRPSIAVNRDGKIVEVHKSQNTDYLYYRMGRVSPGATSIQWNASKNLANNLGSDPVVAYGKNLCVVMWTTSGRLKYKVGHWYDGQFFFNGTYDVYVGNLKPANASIAISQGDEWSPRLVLTFDSNNGLYLMFGRVSADTINWQDTPMQYGEGFEPTVAFNDNGQLIAIHGMNVSGDRRLYARVGKLTQEISASHLTQIISWLSGPVQCASGVRPSVALDNTGNVVTLYTSYSEIHRLVGYIRNNSYYSTSYNTTLRHGEYSSISLALISGRNQVITTIDDGSKQVFAATNSF